ncbi:hypothetical protein BAY59_38630 (plasmid) [Prauserella coralliicola]|nr:hypothetical protein BAY59_38630 [Prauserella coralliicola]
MLLPLLVAGVVVRLLVWLFFEPWRDWAGPAVLAAVIVFLMGWTSIRAVLVAFGVIALVFAWHLRMASPKWLRWVPLALGLAGVLGGGIAEFVVWANNRAAYEQAEQDQHDFAVARMRPDSGIGMMHALIRTVSEDDPQTGCWLFTPPAAAEFAQVVGAPDCPAAIHQLHGQITNARDFANATVPFGDSTDNRGGTEGGGVRVSGCNMYTPVGILDEGPPGGPKLGQLRLEKDPRFPSGGYLITGYTRCGVLPPGVTPTTPQPPPVLPSYAPGFARTLAEAVAERDTEVCVYFTEQGKREFAAAYGVADCPAAVRTLAAKVTDPKTYSDPQDATQDKADGKTTVDACHLTWRKFGNKPGDVAPGPQLGTLTLTAGPRGQGYLIDGFEPC